MRRIRSHLTYANVMVTLLAFIVLTGGTAVALTGSNTVFSDDIVDNEVRTADVRNDTLAGGGLAAPDLQPNSVGNSEVAANSLNSADINESALGIVPNADKLDGINSTGFIRGAKLDLGMNKGDPEAKIATVGPFDINGKCNAITPAGTAVAISATVPAGGPAGIAEAVWSQVQNDDTDGGTFSEEEPILPSGAGATAFVHAGATSGYVRAGGTVVLKSGSGSLVVLDFTALASEGSATCHVWGTATMGS